VDCLILVQLVIWRISGKNSQLDPADFLIYALGFVSLQI